MVMNVDNAWPIACLRQCGGDQQIAERSSACRQEHTSRQAVRVAALVAHFA
jgi:hypothetical protein